MEKYEYDRICTIANLVLKNYKIETPILDMKKVVEKLNGRLVIKGRKYSNETTRLQNDVSGFVITTNVDDYDIIDVAVGIGVMFINMNYLIEDKKWISKSNFDIYYSAHHRIEEQIFAYEFLFPTEKYLFVRKLFTKDGFVYFEKLANFFDVNVKTIMEKEEILRTFRENDTLFYNDKT
jgi:hypothetical protein